MLLYRLWLLFVFIFGGFRSLGFIIAIISIIIIIIISMISVAIAISIIIRNILLFLLSGLSV